MNTKTIETIKNVILMLESHPDNTPSSEFEDMISTLSDLVLNLEMEQKWKCFKKERPICYMSGDWDGRKSDVVICRKKGDEKIFLTECYEGALDGATFFNVCTDDDYIVANNDVEWLELSY